MAVLSAHGEWGDTCNSLRKENANQECEQRGLRLSKKVPDSLMFRNMVCASLPVLKKKSQPAQKTEKGSLRCFGDEHGRYSCLQK